MKKIILLFSFCWLVALASTQSLQQPNYQQYLANSINLSGISLLGEQPYFGIGKKQVLENIPSFLSSGALVNYAPALRKSSSFGVVYPALHLIRQQRGFRSKMKINGSQFGEWDANVHLASDFRHVDNNFVAHFAQNSARMDRNDDNFLDLPLSKRLFLMERTRIKDGDLELNIGTYFLKKEEQNGHLNFDTDDRAYAFGNDMQHLGTSVQAGMDLANHYEKRHRLLAQVDGVLHERRDYYGDSQYIGNQKDFHGLFGYIFEVSKIPQFFIGAKFDYTNLKERFAQLEQVRRERSIGLLARHQSHWSKWLLTETNLELERHNLQKTNIRPSLRLNILFPEEKEFYLNFFSAYDWRYPNLFTDYTRIFVSDYKLQIDQRDLDNWQPNKLWQFGLAASYKTSYYNEIKLQYHYFNFRQKTLWDLYQTPNEIDIYTSQERAFRHLLEVRWKQRLVEQLNLGVTYRYDQSKSTYQGELRLDPFLSLHTIYSTLSYNKNLFYTSLRYHLHSPQQIIGWKNSQSPWLHRLDFKAHYRLYYAMRKEAFKPFSFTFGIDNLLANQQPIIFQEDANGFNGMNLWGIAHGTRFHLGVGYDLRIN